jgi:hypothetical protein
VLGALVVVASLFLPWYGIDVDRVSQTALSGFGFGHAALVVTVGATVGLIVALTGGYVLPRPFSEGVLLMVAGTWAAALVVYQMFDRPEQLAGTTDVGVRMGPFVAIAGALAIVVAGARLRVQEAKRSAAGPFSGPPVGK